MSGSKSERVTPVLPKKKKSIDASFDFANKLNVAPDVFKKSVEQIQIDLAPILRKKAVSHLAHAQTTAAKSFRGEYFLAANEEYQKYLDKQSKNGVWGTYIEATALGEALKCNVVVTSINKDRADATWCLHFESKDAPTIHLYNENNYHWTNDPTSITKGDGNCLYNAFAKSIQLLSPHQPHTTTLSSKSIFNHKSIEKHAIKKQVMIEQALGDAIGSKLTKKDKEIAYELEKQRLSQLPPEELQQIKDDYILALKLAADIDPDDSTIGIKNSSAI